MSGFLKYFSSRAVFGQQVMQIGSELRMNNCIRTHTTGVVQLIV